MLTGLNKDKSRLTKRLIRRNGIPKGHIQERSGTNANVSNLKTKRIRKIEIKN